MVASGLAIHLVGGSKLLSAVYILWVNSVRWKNRLVTIWIRAPCSASYERHTTSEGEYESV